VDREITREIRPYRAIVSALSGGMVSFQPLETTVAATQLYARIAGFDLTVGDEIWVQGRKNPMVIGKIQRSAAGALALAAGLTVPGVTTLGDQVDTNGSITTVTLPAGHTAGTGASISGVAGNGTVGTFSVVGGTGAAAGVIARIAFAAARPDALYTVFFTPMSSGSRGLTTTVGPTSRAVGSVDVDCRSALVNGTTYSWGFLIVGY